MDVENTQTEPVQPDLVAGVSDQNSLSLTDDIAVPQVLSTDDKQEEELLSAITQELQLPDVAPGSQPEPVLDLDQDASTTEQAAAGPTGAAAVVAALNNSEEDQELVAALTAEQAEAGPNVDVVLVPSQDDTPIDSSLHVEASVSKDQPSSNIVDQQESAILAADEQIHLDAVDSVQAFIPDDKQEVLDAKAEISEVNPSADLGIVTAGLAPEIEVDAESVLTSPLGSSIGISAQESSSLSNTSSGSVNPSITSLPALPSLSTLDEEAGSQLTEPQGKPPSSRSAASASRPQRQRATSNRSNSSVGTTVAATVAQPDTSIEASSSRSAHAPPKRAASSRSRRTVASAASIAPSLPSPNSLAAAGTSRTRSLALAKEQKEKDAEVKAARRKSRLARGKRAETTSESEGEDDEEGQQDGSPELVDTSLDNSDRKGKAVKAEEVDNVHKALAATAKTSNADARRPSTLIDVEDADQSGTQRRRSSRNTAATSATAKPASATVNGNGKRSVPQIIDESAALDEEDPDDGVTRCVCGQSDEESAGFMIMCETCKAWQHGPCMGFKLESQCPDTYYCELCRPDLHPTLTRGKRHARTGSSSSARPNVSDIPPPSPSAKPVSKTASDSAPKDSAPPLHRARSSADASVAASLLETKTQSHSPSPGSPGPLSADGKRPMYPSTSHLSAPAQPKRRSTMNSRESAAFDESILLANANAIKESMMMAASAGSPNLGYHASSAFANGNRKRKAGSSHLADEASADATMDTVKEEDEDDENAEPLKTAPEQADALLPLRGSAHLDDEYRQPRVKKRITKAGGRAANGRATADENTIADEESPVPLDSVSQKVQRKRKAGHDDPNDGSEAINNSIHPDDQVPKRRKASPNGQDRDVDAGYEGNAPALHVNSIAIARTDNQADSAQANGSSGNASDVQSRAASAEPPTNGAETVDVNGLVPIPYARKGKGPSSSDDDSSTTAAVSIVTGRGRAGNWRGRGGRGGKISPSKRAALAAAHAASDVSRRPFGRDDTPLYDDFTAPLTWGVPDHLSHLSHLLPTPQPQHLQVPVYTAPGKPATNHSRSRRPSPADVTMGSPSEHSPDNYELHGPFPQLPPQQPISHLYEAPSKIKFPNRRMSIAEMRKRAKTVLDYIGRMQVEMVDRNNRNQVLGRMQERLLQPSTSSTPASTPGANGHASLPPTPNPAVTVLKTASVSATSAVHAGTPLEAASMLDDLSRKLINFQDKFC